MSRKKNRLGEAKVEKQVAIAHNSVWLDREWEKKRNAGFEAVISQSEVPMDDGFERGGDDVAPLPRVEGSVQIESALSDIEGQDIGITREECELEYHVWDVPEPNQFFVPLLFNPDEDDGGWSGLSE